jgi:hypothetical protein
MLPANSCWEETNSVKSVRLVCRLFENLATPFLLTHVRFGPLSTSLTTLTAISLHPVLSKSVKQLTYSGGRYQHFATLTEYENALGRARAPFSRYERPRCMEEVQQLSAAFSRQVQHYDDQSAMEKSGEAAVRVCSALMRMPNVEKVTVSPNWFCFLDKDDEDDFSWKFFLEPQPAYDEAFLFMARILSLTGTKLRELDVESDDHDESGLTGAMFDVMSSMCLTHCRNVFRGLRKVSLSATQEGFGGPMRENAAQILSCAKDLEYLCIQGLHRDRIMAKYFLSTSTWKALTVLNLFNVVFKQEEFLDVLRRHSGTLRDLGLLGVTLTDGTWRPVLECMKHSLSLRKVQIMSVVGEDDEGHAMDVPIPEGALKDYILADGPYPLGS